MTYYPNMDSKTELEQLLDKWIAADNVDPMGPFNDAAVAERLDLCKQIIAHPNFGYCELSCLIRYARWELKKELRELNPSLRSS
jgi:hypothetical protein